LSKKLPSQWRCRTSRKFWWLPNSEKYCKLFTKNKIKNHENPVHAFKSPYRLNRTSHLCGFFFFFRLSLSFFFSLSSTMELLQNGTKAKPSEIPLVNGTALTHLNSLFQTQFSGNIDPSRAFVSKVKRLIVKVQFFHFSLFRSSLFSSYYFLWEILKEFVFFFYFLFTKRKNLFCYFSLLLWYLCFFRAFNDLKKKLKRVLLETMFFSIFIQKHRKLFSFVFSVLCANFLILGKKWK